LGGFLAGFLDGLISFFGGISRGVSMLPVEHTYSACQRQLHRRFSIIQLDFENNIRATFKRWS